MTILVDIPKEIEARLLSEANACGVVLREFVRDLLIEHYEEAEDLRRAESRLNESQPPISSRQLRNNLGLDS